MKGRNMRLVVLAFIHLFYPMVAHAAPVGGDFYGYWSEPESQAYVSLSHASYKISGRYVAVMTYEERPPAATHALIGELFDCLEMQYALAEKVDYGADDQEISSYSNGNIMKSFGQIEEDTRQEFLLIGICDEESGKPYMFSQVKNYFKMIAAKLQKTGDILSDR